MNFIQICALLSPTRSKSTPGTITQSKMTRVLRIVAESCFLDRMILRTRTYRAETPRTLIPVPVTRLATFGIVINS